MTVETTIQRMFDRYPDLFSTRKECYNHLFCVIGNGYEWRHGQVVACDDEATMEEEEWDYATPHPKAEQTKGNGIDIDRHWYPICEYSLIKRIPADIKPDWKEAVEECKEMLRKDGIEV